MRFNLVILSLAILTGNLVNAIVDPPNIGVDVNQVKADHEVLFLKMKEEFEIFHWVTDQDDNVIVDREFAFELTEPAEFQITDFMKGGDVYELLDNGISIGTTSDILPLDEVDEVLFAATPEEALEDPHFSKASYPLEPGFHRITVQVFDSADIDGTGAVRIVSKTQAAAYGKRNRNIE